MQEYGLANQIIFDNTNKYFHFLNPTGVFSYGNKDCVRILGCFFDVKLLMHAEVKHIAVEAGLRLRAVFRS